MTIYEDLNDRCPDCGCNDKHYEERCSCWYLGRYGEQEAGWGCGCVDYGIEARLEYEHRWEDQA